MNIIQTGASLGAQRVVFTTGAAGRIANAVLKSERGDRDSQSVAWYPRMDGRPGGGVTFRVCIFTGAWAINSAKVVTFKNQTATPNTVSVTNLTMHLPDIGLTPPFDCEIARDGTAWFLVSAVEHNVKRGTFTAPWAKNTSKTVSLVNGGSVTAINRHANVSGTGTKNCTVGRDGMDWELIAAECG
jgi:hypothetical protein